jgi:hypothetical protein
VKRESQLGLKSAFLKPYIFIVPASISQIIFNNALVTKFGLYFGQQLMLRLQRLLQRK